MDFFKFSVPTKIVFSPGISKDFGAELETIGIQKYFIVTDSIIEKLKIIDPIIEGIKKAGYEVTGLFSDVPPDSGVKTIEKVAALAKASGAEGFIAIGGGSVLDTAKGANILFTLGGNLIDDYSGAQTITADLSPLIAIPTTAGTGSEVTEAIVILDEVNQVKLSFVDSHLLPTMTILDPELTLKLPPLVTAGLGLDALTHAIEAVMSVQKGPVSDALAYQAVRLIFNSIEKAVADGSDIEARSDLLVASNLAGMAFNHSMVGVVHAVAHTVGALFHVHHGTANGIFLPFGMEYNLQERASEIAFLAPAMGVTHCEHDDEKTALHCIQAVKDLINRLGQLCKFPTTFTQAGLKKENIDLIAERSPDDGATFYNPREVNTDDLKPFIEKAF
ncbi:MAG: iron-containing alcohol dehydrogenase [uncultured bacterium]|nr:MAG: iron-containing alcohol dehydrogenase [uncultured bacterium]